MRRKSGERVWEEQDIELERERVSEWVRMYVRGMRQKSRERVWEGKSLNCFTASVPHFFDREEVNSFFNQDKMHNNITL